MFDIIGDIHGYACKLEELLQKLGYSKKGQVYSHPERKVLFIGDYIDRGPQIRDTLEIVKAMVDSGSAIALMGNHEYNALCFHFESKDGGHLRKHKIKNIIQHYETLKQFQNKQSEYEEYLYWFKTLPIFFENDNFRAVHACWENNSIEYLRNKLVNIRLTDDLIYESVKKDTRFYSSIDTTLKGIEMNMPEGLFFTDKDGTKRSKIRIKWWEDPTMMTYNSISVVPIDSLPKEKIDFSNFDSYNFYSKNEKPVFFGHYWLDGMPSILKDNVCCLDYSVAKEGKLVAYRYNGESVLDNRNLIYV